MSPEPITGGRSLAATLEHLQAALGMTQQQAADAVNVSRQTWNMWINGHRLPTRSAIYAVADALTPDGSDERTARLRAELLRFADVGDAEPSHARAAARSRRGGDLGYAVAWDLLARFTGAARFVPRDDLARIVETLESIAAAYGSPMRDLPTMTPLDADATGDADGGDDDA